MARTISVLVLALACLSAGAATIADADALFKEKLWRKAAEAYEAVASGRGDRGEKLKAAMRAALSHENAGSLKDAEKWADKVIRESAGRSDGETVASAFAAKQRILFRRKAKFAQTLLNDAVRRLGWTREVSSLYEKDAFACVKEKNVPAAKKRLSMRKIVLSPTGSNVVAMIEFAENGRSAGREDGERMAGTLLSVNSRDHALASRLADLLCKSAKGDALVHVAMASADIASAAGEEDRAVSFFETALGASGDRIEKQKLRSRFAQYLESAGRAKRCAEVYDEMVSDIKEGDAYAAPMKRCIAFFAGSGRGEKAMALLDRYCGEDSGVYETGERKALRARLEKAMRREAAMSADEDGWKSIREASTLAGKGRHGDAVKILHSVVAGHAGEVKATALFNLAKCYRTMRKFRMAVDALDSLMPLASDDLKLTALKLKVTIQLTDLHDPQTARKTCADVAKNLDRESSAYRLIIAEVEKMTAMCDFAGGDAEAARPVFKRENDIAKSRRDAVEIGKWTALLEACEAVRLFGAGKADRPFFLEMVSGELLFAEEDYKAAAATFRNGISQRGCPPSLRAYMTMRLARCLVKLREYKSALDAYTTIKTSYRNAPCAPDAMLMAGVLCVGHLDNVQAGEGFFKFIEDEYPKSPEAERALFYRTTLAIWTKRWDEAKALRQLFVGRYPNSRQIGIMKGEYSELIARRITSLDDNETGNLR